jgi:dTDP-4-amino-4,6-dideoxygalactose transaminase
LPTNWHWAYGPLAQRLERELAERLDIHPDQVIATMSCSAALHCAAQHTKGGVYVPALTYPGTYSGKELSDGAHRIECDDWGNPQQSVHYWAIVDLWGRSLATRYSWTVLDAAHRVLDPEPIRRLATGENGQYQAVCYSFAPQKELSSFCGGALIWHSQDTGHLRVWLNNGAKGRGPSGPYVGGIKGLMPDSAAALLFHQLEQHENSKIWRQLILEAYVRHLPGGAHRLRTLPGDASGHLAVMLCDTPEQATQCKALLTENDIGWSVHYEIPTWCDPNNLSQRLLTLPCHTQMSQEDAKRVCRVLERAL